MTGNSFPKPTSILYICTGNICRSPLAEALLKDYAVKQGVAGRLDISSAGTHGLTGNPATWEAQEAGRQWGMDLSGHRAREITPGIAAGADIILVATQRHLEWLNREFPEHENKVYLAMLFPRRLAGERPRKTDIPDPIGESVKYYLEVLRMLQPTLPAVLESVTGLKAGLQEDRTQGGNG